MTTGSPSRHARWHCRMCLVRIIICLLSVVAVVQPARGQAFSAATTPPFWFQILVPGNRVPSQIYHATFALGSVTEMVFAANLPVQQVALQQITGISGATVVHLANATILRIPLHARQTVSAVAANHSFHVVLGEAAAGPAIAPQFRRGQVVFPSGAAGPVITVDDSLAGEPLLVGTVTGSGFFDRRLEGPGYSTIPASSGVVVVASSDELALSASASGFVLSATTSTMPLPVGNPPVSAEQLAAPKHDNGVDLPDGSIIALRRRLDLDQLRVAHAPPLDRLAPSLRLARTLLALDLGPEAHGVLMDVLRSDPAAATSRRRQALLGVADVLSHHPKALALDWPDAASASGQSRFWHGLADGELHKSAKAAKLLSEGVGALLGEPPLVRDIIAPIAAEILVAEDKTNAAQQLLSAIPGVQGMPLVRAELLQETGHAHTALAAYHPLLRDPDQRTAGIAEFRTVMLRAQLHQLTPLAAADELEDHVFEWRSTHHERDVRLAIARFRAQAAQWPRAMTGLIKAEKLLPSAKTKIEAVRMRLFARMVASGALDRLAPIAAAAVVQNNMDLVPPGSGGVPVLQTLSRLLLSLGLPDEAAKIMNNLMNREADVNSRAKVGVKLARIEFESHHLKRAQAALNQTAAANLPGKLADARTLLADEIAAKDGDKSGLVSLAGSADPAALKVAVHAAASHHHWLTAERTEQKVAELIIPSTGSLNRKARRVVTQWAVAAARAGDRKTLAKLRRRYLPRMNNSREATLFDTITASPLPQQTNLAGALKQISAIEKVGKVIDAPAAFKALPDHGGS